MLKGQGVRRLLELLALLKLYLGLAALFAAGIALSPIAADGTNVFLSPDNLADVLRQVSNNGILAVGMTMVILVAGIDLSVGTVMALGSTLTAMLLTVRGWSTATYVSVPATAAVVGSAVAVGAWRLSRARRTPAMLLAPGAGAVAAVLVWIWLARQSDTGFSVLGVLVAVPCVTLLMGTLNGLLIAKGRLQPFIVTLAMMIAALGSARLIAGKDHSVYQVYIGPEGATPAFQFLRARLGGVVPVPGLIFLLCVAASHFVLKKLRFGRYVYAIGGNEEAARLSGINVAAIKTATYAVSGLLAGLTGVLYCAQYRQGKPDAGTGMELDAIAAVVIGGTSLLGGRGSVIGTLVGVFIFGLLNNILQLRNVDYNVQLVFKGVIIVAAVLLQEGRFGDWLRRLRRSLPHRAGP
ncbi:MAG: ABC transporter permease [bacterium]|jgi:simple sugar transport system permease protein|nr:ABC transporter permease [candidate division KSB1 bacterium]MDH7560999.1 ABC transporter permease [bacterium]